MSRAKSRPVGQSQDIKVRSDVEAGEAGRAGPARAPPSVLKHLEESREAKRGTGRLGKPWGMGSFN